jgi:SPP1 gp7 family putative phage head morphogenesis protein
LAKVLRSIAQEVAGKLRHLGKAAEEDRDEADAAVAAVDWLPVARAVQSELVPVARDGAQRALVSIGIAVDESITSQTFTSAVAWAKARSAELVGKSWVDGELVDNPDADMAISDSLREDIQSAVADALDEGASAAELSDTIEGLAGFSEERATMIARTEIIRAHAQGQMSAMRESGVVEQKAWSTSEDGDTCDDCTENADEGEIGLEDDFPSGDDSPPAHPNCRCAVVAVIGSADGEGEESEDEDTEEEDDTADEAAE